MLCFAVYQYVRALGLGLLSIDEIVAARQALGSRVRTTPLVDLAGSALGEALPGKATFAKFEHWQRTGTFKFRGALLSIDALDAAGRAAGVTAVSAGNHAIATAAAAEVAGVSARVVMMRSANPLRVARCEAHGAVVEFADDVHAAFERVAAIQRDEGRALIHPFDSRAMLLGSGTLGLEMLEQCPAMECLVVPVGGGGLIGGIAAAVKQRRPDCRVIGVEPTGADSMRRSLAAGSPCSLDAVRTIADSLGAPFAMDRSFAHSQAFVDDVVLVSDDDLRGAMRRLRDELGLVVEPACAATTAAALGPLADDLTGRTAVLLFCGSNIDTASADALLSSV